MPQKKIVVEYVWIGGEGELRSKARVLSFDEEKIQHLTHEDIPSWNYDGSSTKQAPGNDSEVIIVARKLVRCPFRRGDNFLVMCDQFDSKMNAIPTNHREWANNVFNKNLEEEPWFGIEQEFFMIDGRTDKALGFNNEVREIPQEQGFYYCSVGTGNSFGRSLIDEALENFIYADLTCSGINAEVAPGQWEFQIGPCTGIDSGDQLWLARYILERTGEKYNIRINYHPKLMKGDWNGSGCHTNYSTKSMREDDGLKVIEEAIEKLSAKHDEHMAVYGSGNELRMTGQHETSSYDKFSSGRANRGASVRIGNETIENGKGYFEDRRPSSNMNPYLVTAKIFETTCL